MKLRTILFFTLVALRVSVAEAQPPRDAVRPLATGSATIHGVISSRGSDPQPQRRARVSLDGLDVEYRQTTITGDDGTFRFESLPAGSYRLRAAKEPFVSAESGARRIGGIGVPITVRAGEVRRADIVLARGSVITGRVQTPDGGPGTGLSVVVFTSRFVASAGERRLVEAGVPPALTDDRGVYRVYGLPPGDYFIAVRPRIPILTPLQILTDAEIRDALADATGTFWSARPGSTAPTRPPSMTVAPVGRSVGITPIYFPGTPFFERATAIRLGEAETRSGVDVDVQYVPLANIEGAISVPAGAERVQITLSSANPADVSQPPRFAFADAAGGFTFRAVAPGNYKLVARLVSARPGPGSAAASHTGSADLIVAGEDIGGVTIPLKPPLTISGRIVFEPPFELPVTLSGTQAPWVPLAAANLGGGSLAPVVTIEGNAFTLGGLVPGSYRLTAPMPGVRTPVGRWWLKSATIGGHEILDAPLELAESATDAALTWKDTASTLTGTVRDATGRAAPQAYALVFARDERAWFSNSRRIAAVRTDAQGQFSVRNLPPGEYFAIATYDIDAGEWFDSVVLREWVRSAVGVTVAGDEAQARDLVIQPRDR